MSGNNGYSGGFNGLSVRGDSTSCPLAFGLDTYYNCPYACSYCAYLSLPHTWGGKAPWRFLDLEWFERRLRNGLKNHNPRTPVSSAIRQRKTMRVGNRYDPLPPVESEQRIARGALEILADLDWEIKLESKNAALMLEYSDRLIGMGAIISTTVLTGLDDDWRLLEARVPSSPTDRLEAMERFVDAGLQVGVLAEPFIPGYHTVAQWFEFLLELKSYGINRVNVYNLKMNSYNVRRLLELDLDVERILDHSDDETWGGILFQLLAAAAELGIHCGCPDFVNAGRVKPTTNTCCGVDVTAPCTFNLVNWRAKGLENGRVTMSDFLDSWDGVGDINKGWSQFNGQAENLYSLTDTGLFELTAGEWVLKE